jgi:hypothetical protein
MLEYEMNLLLLTRRVCLYFHDNLDELNCGHAHVFLREHSFVNNNVSRVLLGKTMKRVGVVGIQ